jgi:hypothetical protein
MTYQDDPNLNRRDRRGTADDTSYTGWIIGGVLALAVILGIFVMMGRGNNTNTAANTPNRPAATAPATTGTAVPAPGTGQGTAAPVQNAPPAPAR